MTDEIKKSSILGHVKVKTVEDQSLVLKQLDSKIEHNIDAHGRFGRKPRLMSGMASSLLRAKSERVNESSSVNTEFEALDKDDRFGRKPLRMSGKIASQPSDKHGQDS